MRYFVKYLGGTDYTFISNQYGQEFDIDYAPDNKYINNIIGELVAVVKFPKSDHYSFIFYNKNLKTTNTFDKNWGGAIPEHKTGYWYLESWFFNIYDENGNLIPHKDDGDNEYWKSLFSGWGSKDNIIYSPLAPLDDSFFAKAIFYLKKYWWLLLIIIFWKTIKEFVNTILGIFKTIKPNKSYAKKYR